MTPQTILNEFNRRGIRLRAEGDKLIAKPLSAVPPELRAAVRVNKAALLTCLRTEQARAETDRLARADGRRPLPEPSHPAYNILETCRRYGVALRIDPATGDLMVGKLGAKADEPTQPWPSLLMAIEAHLEALSRLIESGWTLKAGFPKSAAA